MITAAWCTHDPQGEGMALRRQRGPWPERRPPLHPHRFVQVARARSRGPYPHDLYRVLAHWLKDRYLELAPKYWAATRARLDTSELAKEFGPLTVPPPADPPEQPTTYQALARKEPARSRRAAAWVAATRRLRRIRATQRPSRAIRRARAASRRVHASRSARRRGANDDRRNPVLPA